MKVEYLDNKIKLFLYEKWGKAQMCQHCTNEKRKSFCWTLKKGCKTDKRRSSYLQLCRSCLELYHRGVERKWAQDKQYRKTCEQNTRLRHLTPVEKEKARLVRLKNRGCQIHFPHKIMNRYFKPSIRAKEYLDKVVI